MNCPRCGRGVMERGGNRVYFWCESHAIDGDMDQTLRQSAQCEALTESDALNKRLQEAIDIGDLLFEELDDKTPDANCSCFLRAPCADCENHAPSREALKAWKEYKEGVKP